MNPFTWIASLFGARTMPETPPSAPVEPSSFLGAAGATWTPSETPPAEPAEDKAAYLAEGFEGFSAAPYWDPNGKVFSQGFGSTHDDKLHPITAASPPITRETALTWLTDDMHFAFQDIAEMVKVPLTDDERAALASFIYNVGEGNFNSSTLLRLLNQKDYVGADAEFQKWSNAGGQFMAGLLRRRLAEAQLFKGDSNT